MTTPREQAIEIAITGITIYLDDQKDWLEETSRGERVIVQTKKIINQLRRKIGADEIEEVV